MRDKIGIVMGGYIDRNDKLMSRSELNAAIVEIQNENKELRESLSGDTGSNTKCPNCKKEIPLFRYIAAAACKIAEKNNNGMPGNFDCTNCDAIIEVVTVTDYEITKVLLPDEQ